MTYEIRQREAELRGIAIGRTEGRTEGRAEGKIIGAIEMGRIMGLSDMQIKDSIIRRFNLSPADAAKYMNAPAQ